MADVKVPIRFEIYKGDNLVREEVLAQDVIKIGKLASSHLRLDDETVSRMHAVIEATSPDDINVVDLGSTRGTTVNGERITKARLQSGDEIMFGDCRVIVTFLGAEQAQATPAPQAGAWAARRRRAAVRAAAAAAVRAAAAAAVRAAAAAAVRGAGRRLSGPELPAAVVRAAVVLGRAGRRRRGRGSRRLARDGGPDGLPRRRHGHAPPLQPRGEDRRTARGRRCCTPASPSRSSRSIIFVATAIDVGAEKARYEAWQTAGKDSKSFVWKNRSPAGGALVFGGIVAGLALSYMGLKRRGKTSPNFLIGSDADVDAPVSPDYVPSSSHPLVAATGADYVVNVTPRMTGEVYVDDQSYQLQQFIQQRGSSFSLPAGRLGAARLRRDDVRRHRDGAPAHARRAVPDLALGRADLHGRLGRRARPVPAHDLLGPAGPEVAVARSLQLATTAS